MTIDYPVFNETGPPCAPGTLYPTLRGGMRYDIDIRINPLTGRRIQYHLLQTVSDIHWGSRFSRAHRGCMLQRDNESDTMFVIGDMMGGIEMMKLPTYKMPTQWHRQGVALLLQKNPIAVVGNHEIGLERHVIKPFSLFGMTICDEAEFTDPKGRRFLIEHGHKRRYAAMGFIDPEEGDRIGDALLNLGGEIDHILQEAGWEKASVAMWCKKRFKTFINNKMGVLALTEQAIDNSPYAGSFSGDTHMPGFHYTPGGKLLVNDGSWCDHVNDAVMDKYGQIAVRTWHRHHVDYEMEDGNKYSVRHVDIGCPHFAEDYTAVENEYTAQADHMFRLAARMWPAKDRQGVYAKIEKQEREIERLCRIIGVDPTARYQSGQIVVGADVPKKAAKQVRRAEKQLANLDFARVNGNLPPRSPRPELARSKLAIMPRPPQQRDYGTLAIAGD